MTIQKKGIQTFNFDSNPLIGGRYSVGIFGIQIPIAIRILCKIFCGLFSGNNKVCRNPE